MMLKRCCCVAEKEGCRSRRIAKRKKDGFDLENYSIVQFAPFKKEVTTKDCFRGGVKKMVGKIRKIRDSDNLFHCILYAKIHKMHRENGWTYLACNRCGRSAKEVDDDQSSSSGMRSASLLLFDDLVFKLSGEQCVHLIRQHGENYDDYIPDELNVLVGKRLLFRFHYTDDHINNNNHVYQVKMLSQDEAMITMNLPAPSNANSSRFTNIDSIPFKLDETTKSSYVATKGNASHRDGEHSYMEIESDARGSGSGKRIFINLDDYDEEEA
ncbi:replication protein A 70 kDa DNA-binding subunit B [Tanacetum coccineum]